MRCGGLRHGNGFITLSVMVGWSLHHDMGGTGTRVGVKRMRSRCGSPAGPYDILCSCVGKLGSPRDKLRPYDVVGDFGGTGGTISLARRRDTCASGSSVYDLMNRCRIIGPFVVEGLSFCRR